MKALVISDIHGSGETLTALIKKVRVEDTLDALIFCGDGYMDAYAHRMDFSRWLGVRGNCDISVPTGVPTDRYEKLGEVDVLITHGHLYRVKRTLLTLNLRAVEIGAQVVCFGHTHQPFYEWQRDVLMLNPGALCLGYYAILETGGIGKAKANLMEL